MSEEEERGLRGQLSNTDIKVSFSLISARSGARDPGEDLRIAPPG